MKVREPSPLRRISNYQVKRLEDMSDQELNELRTMIQLSNEAVEYLEKITRATKSKKIKEWAKVIFDCLHDITHLRESPLEYKGEKEI